MFFVLVQFYRLPFPLSLFVLSSSFLVPRSPFYHVSLLRFPVPAHITVQLHLATLHLFFVPVLVCGWLTFTTIVARRARAILIPAAIPRLLPTLPHLSPSFTLDITQSLPPLRCARGVITPHCGQSSHGKCPWRFDLTRRERPSQKPCCS